LDLTKKQEGLRKSFSIYNFGITSYCLSPSGITFCSTADEIEINKHIQNVMALNFAKNHANWCMYFKEMDIQMQWPCFML